MGDTTPARSDGETGELEVRPAREDDRDAVLAFCARAWDEGDYIADVWDDWLRDKTGVLLIGVVSSRLVAIVHTRMMSDEEAWLEGIRVDPDLRRQGIGRVMVSRALVAAHERGATVARLFVDHAAAASHRLVAKFGFTRVAEVALYLAEPLPAEEVALPADEVGPRLSTPGIAAFEGIWAWLEQSNLSPFNGGLEFLGWSARGLTEPSLREYLAAGEVWLLEEHGAILALAVARALPASAIEPAWLQVRYMDGLPESVGRLALALRDIAALRGVSEVDLWLPDLLILQDAMYGAGYGRETEGAMWVYARELA
jgi:ribosomal protein S18 acetylase RimI-like enzyme